MGVWNLASASRSSHIDIWITQATWMAAGLVLALAVVLVGGLVSSTLLARLVTPAAYKLLAPPVRASAAPPNS